MTNLDYVFFLVAGIVGLTPYETRYRHNLAWAIIALWALLKLFKAV